MLDAIRYLELGKKLSPKAHPEISWCYVFFPGLIAYIFLLTRHINCKPHIGSIEIYDAKFDQIVYPNSYIEIISDGSVWSEGPLWIEEEESSSTYLIYSDTKLNRIYRWDEGKGLLTVGKTIMLKNSGCGVNMSHCESTFEPGSNGLLRLLPRYRKASAPHATDILICQHGDRSIMLLRENGTRSYMATHYKGRRLNSPNDLVWSDRGDLYFTDPPYGLYNHSGAVVGRELPLNGVFMIRAEDVARAMQTGVPASSLILLNKEFTRPNGLAFSPDYSKLYVSNSDKRNAVWKAFDVDDSGMLSNGTVFFNATELLSSGEESFGLPDGLKVDIHGNLFATGPGGVLVFSPEAELIGRFRFDRPVSNVGFGSDGRLYFTASDIVARVRVKTKSATRILLQSSSNGAGATRPAGLF